MFVSLWVLLTVALVSFFNVSAARFSSFAVDVRGHGVEFIDGPNNTENIGIVTSDDLSYSTNITLDLTVLLDTGSFALVLTNSTDVRTTQTFGRGSVTGNVSFAELRLGDLVVSSQAFLKATKVSDLGNAKAILGMSFNADSHIQASLIEAWGEQAAESLGKIPMSALFAQNPDIPRAFDIQLARASEQEKAALGVFMIGGHDTGFERVSDAPQLPVMAPDHWSLVLDAMRINGKSFVFNRSRIAEATAGKVVAALDTGFSLPPLPPSAVDAIYSGIPGAVFDENSKRWLAPCDAATTLSFVFAGQEFFVHPLDLTRPVVGTVNGAKRTACLNSYQYLTLDPKDFTGFDLILGDAFLRNVYTSFNYGNASSRGVGRPFVQMVLTTPNMSVAIQEFKMQRAATLSQLPPIIDPLAAVHSRSSNGSERRRHPSANWAFTL
ncbi:acid protease [Trametes polyzona]|nr:acid protease [Trametes polyzona]